MPSTGALRALTSAVKNAPDAVLAAIRSAGSKFKNLKLVPSRVTDGAANEAAKNLARNADGTVNAKSIDDAVDTEKALADVDSHPLGKGPGETPKTSVTGEAPPGKDPTTDMPDGPPKLNARWEQVKPYVAAGGTALLAGVAVGTWLAVAGVKLQNTDGVEVKITKIEKVKDEQKKYKFTYETQGGQNCGNPPIACIQSAFNPCKGDTFTFRSTYTNPTLNDVTALVIDVGEDSVEFELDLTDIGTGTPEWGFMTCHSSFRNQFRGSIRDAVQLLVDVAKDVADPVIGGFCDVIPIPLICPDSLNFSNWVLWLCIICLLLSCAVFLFLVLS
jgi:hypothetical protein